MQLILKLHLQTSFCLLGCGTLQAPYVGIKEEERPVGNESECSSAASPF